MRLTGREYRGSDLARLLAVALLAIGLVGQVAPVELLASLVNPVSSQADDSEQDAEETLALRHASEEPARRCRQPNAVARPTAPTWRAARPQDLPARPSANGGCEHALRNGLGAPLVC